MAWQHGTPSGYSNHGCRCDDCTEAWRSWFSEWRKNRYSGTCKRVGCTRKVALLNPSHGLCKRHLDQEGL